MLQTTWLYTFVKCSVEGRYIDYDYYNLLCVFSVNDNIVLGNSVNDNIVLGRFFEMVSLNLSEPSCYQACTSNHFGFYMNVLWFVFEKTVPPGVSVVGFDVFSQPLPLFLYSVTLFFSLLDSAIASIKLHHLAAILFTLLRHIEVCVSSTIMMGEAVHEFMRLFNVFFFRETMSNLWEGNKEAMSFFGLDCTRKKEKGRYTACCSTSKFLASQTRQLQSLMSFKSEMLSSSFSSVIFTLILRVFSGNDHLIPKGFSILHILIYTLWKQTIVCQDFFTLLFIFVSRGGEENQSKRQRI